MSRSAELDPHKLKTYRAAKGWSQEELANRAGLNKRTVERAETGKAISLGVVKLLADALGVSPDQLLRPVGAIELTFVERGLDGAAPPLTFIPARPTIRFGNSEFVPLHLQADRKTWRRDGIAIVVLEQEATVELHDDVYGFCDKDGIASKEVRYRPRRNHVEEITVIPLLIRELSDLMHRHRRARDELFSPAPSRDSGEVRREIEFCEQEIRRTLDTIRVTKTFVRESAYQRVISLAGMVISSAPSDEQHDKNVSAFNNAISLIGSLRVWTDSLRKADADLALAQQDIEISIDRWNTIEGRYRQALKYFEFCETAITPERLAEDPELQRFVHSRIKFYVQLRIDFTYFHKMQQFTSRGSLFDTKAAVEAYQTFVSGVDASALTVPNESTHDEITMDWSTFKPEHIAEIPSIWCQTVWNGSRAKRRPKPSASVTVDTDKQVGRFVKLQTVNHSVHVARPLYADPTLFRYLHWQWMAKELPKDGDVTMEATDNAACQVAVFLGTGRDDAPIVFYLTWNTSLANHEKYEAFRTTILGISPRILRRIGAAVGLPTPEAWNFVLRTGGDTRNEWKSETIDLIKCLRSAYPKRFGTMDAPEAEDLAPMIYGICVLSNSQRTTSTSLGCFGPLRLSRYEDKQALRRSELVSGVTPR